MITKKTFLNLILLLFITLLQACASSGDYDDETTSYTAAELYKEARANLDNENYESAIQLYEKLESRFPYGEFAERSQLEIAYAYHKFDEPESSILAAERFIKLHPQHANVDYAYYLRGLTRFNTSPSFLDRWFNQDIAERDPKNARKAFEYFAELIKKFPKSRYVPDAIKRMHILRNNLAKHEIYVANYYIGRGAFLSAANRAKFVVENYQNTPAVPGALVVMVKAYRKLGMPKLAADALRVLELNYPEEPAIPALKTNQ